jgi:hypothetical protein
LQVGAEAHSANPPAPELPWKNAFAEIAACPHPDTDQEPEVVVVTPGYGAVRTRTIDPVIELEMRRRKVSATVVPVKATVAARLVNFDLYMAARR